MQGNDASTLGESERYRKLACEIRAELRMLKSPEMIEDLSLLADRYDALAEHLEAANSDNAKVHVRSVGGQRSAED